MSRPGARGYEPGSYSSVFVGIAPTDAPRFVIGVVVKKPQGGTHYGGVVAAPAVAHMAERILSMCQVPRTASARKGVSVAVKTSHGKSGGD